MAQRFFRRGVTQVFFPPAVSNLSAPSSGEITAGTELTSQIETITGWMLTNTPIKTPDLVTTFDTEIPGIDSTAASSFTMYDLKDTTALKDSLAKGLTGFVLWCPYGKVTGKRCETWPSTIISNSYEYVVTNNPARYKVEFSVTQTPVLMATLP